MTALETRPAPRLITRRLAVVFAVGFGAMTSFWLLLSVVPMYLGTTGGDGAAGLATTALMLSTVTAELVVTRLVSRFGYRAVYAAGLVLLGAPALALPLTSATAAVLAVCLVRGLGFAICVVVGGAMAAALVPAQRRGEGLGLQAVVSGIPAVGALPAGIWLVGAVGYGPVFVAGAVAALLGLVAVPVLPARIDGDGDGDGDPDVEHVEHAALGIGGALRTAPLLRPALVFATTAIAGGITVTFLPLAGTDAATVATALLVQTVASTLARWWAGRVGDRRGPGVLVLPGVALSAAGILLLVLVAEPAALLAAMIVFGLGFGITQGATLALMYARVTPAGFGTVSALWNLGYDAGYGVGAAVFGVLAAQTGYPAAFALTAVPMLLALRSARRDGR